MRNAYTYILQEANHAEPYYGFVGLESLWNLLFYMLCCYVIKNIGCCWFLEIYFYFCNIKNTNRYTSKIRNSKNTQ